jgi:hypothetical protein
VDLTLFKIVWMNWPVRHEAASQIFLAFLGTAKHKQSTRPARLG